MNEFFSQNPESQKNNNSTGNTYGGYPQGGQPDSSRHYPQNGYNQGNQPNSNEYYPQNGYNQGGQPNSNGYYTQNGYNQSGQPNSNGYYPQNGYNQGNQPNSNGYYPQNGYNQGNQPNSNGYYTQNGYNQGNQPNSNGYYPQNGYPQGGQPNSNGYYPQNGYPQGGQPNSNGYYSQNGYNQANRGIPQVYNGHPPVYGYGFSGQYAARPAYPTDPYIIMSQEKAEIKRRCFSTFLEVFIHDFGSTILAYGLLFIAELLFGFSISYNENGIPIYDWVYQILGCLPSIIMCAAIFLFEKTSSHISLKQFFPSEKITPGFLAGALGMSMLFYFASVVLNAVAFTVFEGFGYTPISDAYDLETDYSTASMIMSFILTVILAPICEELMYRGVVLRKLANMNTRFGIVMSAILFGLMHGNLSQAILGFCVGLVLGYIVVETGSLLPSIICHMCINFIACSYDYAYLLMGRDEDLADTYWSAVICLMAVLGIITLIVLLCKRKIRIPQQTEYSRRRGWPVALSCISFYLLMAYLIINVISVMDKL